jgi:hypothetical protein
MPSSLNADELGEKGQARFKEICADAKGMMRFNSFPQEYEQMIESAKTETGCQAVWSRQPT